MYQPPAVFHPFESSESFKVAAVKHIIRNDESRAKRTANSKGAEGALEVGLVTDR